MKKLDEAIIRAFDFASSLFALISLFPLFLVISLWIKLDSPGPVFFRQKRLGYKGRIYSIYKFRTMVDGAENIGMKSLVTPNDFRITKCGKLLRVTSIDELPQLINVLKGEMSIVGPRPGLPEHFKRYSQWQKTRLGVKPGITGEAQIHGRNTITWPQRIEYDIKYVKNRSFLRNLKIILFTIPVLLRKDFIYGAPPNFEFATEADDTCENETQRKCKPEEQPHSSEAIMLQ